jgi:MFS family permease
MVSDFGNYLCVAKLMNNLHLKPRYESGTIRDARRLRRRTMRLSIAEGGIALITVALSDAFYIPYLTAMGATTVQIALGAGLPMLFAGLAQLIGPAAQRKLGSRKKVLILATTCLALCFIPLAFLGLSGWRHKVWLAIVIFLTAMIMANLPAPSWADWFSRIVPQKRHGKYFAFRNRLLAMVQLAVAVTAGYLLDYGVARVMLMFMIIWLTCSGVRLVGTALFFWHYDPPLLADDKCLPLGLMSFIRDLPRSRFGIFTLAGALVNLGASIATPFFTVHMLVNLHWSYLSYTVVTMTPLAAIVLFSSVWGRLVDRWGSLTVLKLAIIGIFIQPLPWVFATNFWLLFVFQVLAGISWCGFNLAIFTFYISATRPYERVAAVSYFNAIYFMSFFIGTTLAGVVLPRLPIVSQWSLQSLFLLSAIVRILPLILLHYIGDDVNDVERKCDSLQVSGMG